MRKKVLRQRLAAAEELNGRLADALRVVAVKAADGRKPVFNIAPNLIEKANRINVELYPAKAGGVRVAIVSRHVPPGKV